MYSLVPVNLIDPLAECKEVVNYERFARNLKESTVGLPVCQHTLRQTPSLEIMKSSRNDDIS